MRAAIRFMLQSLATLLLLSAAFLPALAQGESQSTREENERDIEQRRLNLGTLEMRSGRNAKRRRPKPLAQIQEVFTRLQVVNNELAEAVSRGGELDLNLVAKSAAEIKELAERLIDDMALPEPKKAPERPKLEDVDNIEGLKRRVSALDELVVEFAHNPVFKEAGGDDARLGAKARSDLEAIIELSGHVKKDSEGLNKPAQKPD